MSVVPHTLRCTAPPKAVPAVVSPAELGRAAQTADARRCLRCVPHPAAGARGTLSLAARSDVWPVSRPAGAAGRSLMLGLCLEASAHRTVLAQLVGIRDLLGGLLHAVQLHMRKHLSLLLPQSLLRHVCSRLRWQRRRGSDGCAALSIVVVTCRWAGRRRRLHPSCAPVSLRNRLNAARRRLKIGANGPPRRKLGTVHALFPGEPAR
jgi:hypothetical protein